MKLVIVESPNKVATIQGYLGSGYRVMASKGHIRDLATTGECGYGVDIKNNFKPTYKISSSQYKTVNELKSVAKKADEVILASDPDREGEAIAWHLACVLGLDFKKTKRLVVREITESAIKNAIQNPIAINLNLVSAQEARRIMDRIIGFSLSSLLNKKMKSRSAGRVQSAVLKMITDHENDILAFVPTPYWSLNVDVTFNDVTFKADFSKYLKTRNIEQDEVNNEILAKLSDKKLRVKSIKVDKKTVESKAPFSLSTLQQEAFSAYGFSVSMTTSIAQKLFEGITYNGSHTGLITYPRTESNRLGSEYIAKTKSYIVERFGEEYFSARRPMSKKALQQNGHAESIRPVNNAIAPYKIKDILSPNEYKLYSLIYSRTMMSLMSAKIEEVTTYTLEKDGVEFKVSSTKTIFDGFTRYLPNKEEKAPLPDMTVGDELVISKIANEKKMTTPPARYNEGKIVKLMEDEGIGRPSTYSSTIKTLLSRKYIVSKSGIVTPTEQGMRTAHVLNKYFANLVDAKYTSLMEKDLDDIQEGIKDKTVFLKEFYKDYIDEYNDAKEKMYVDGDVVVPDQFCPKCGKPLVIKKSRYGEFIACSGFPKCDYRLPVEHKIEKTGSTCPECGAPLVYRVNKKGKKFIACSNYPNCKHVEPFKKTKFKKEKDSQSKGIA